ncbi:hypothetical protein MIZ03_1192 [Rhodoferax lithotrophicus]|uniref:CAAX amino terminal protease self-immunity n=2 Tax=Rhodoferax lithotrophicus TaxID=2798804 RepID=A0ABN6D2Y2_9BURK|nr:hypothetical protein MIZ03_1192 [Rhodoferax sp. MIZ03]
MMPSSEGNAFGAQETCDQRLKFPKRKAANLCKKTISNIFNPPNLDRKSLIRFCFQAFLVTTIGAIIVVAFTHGLMLAIGIKDTRLPTDTYKGFNVKDFLGVVIFAPVVETLILGLFIKIASFFSNEKIIVCCVIAVVAAIFHGMNGIYTFFGPMILFFSFSYSFILWRTHSYKYAYISACVPHILNNLSSFLLVGLLWRIQ